MDRRERKPLRYSKEINLCINSQGKLPEWRMRQRNRVAWSNKLVQYLLDRFPEDRLSWCLWHEQKGIFVWLMVCLWGAGGYLPLPLEPWQCRPRTRLIWAYIERLSSVVEPRLLKACQRSSSRILLCRMRHPTLQQSALLHTALIPKHIYGLA